MDEPAVMPWLVLSIYGLVLLVFAPTLGDELAGAGWRLGRKPAPEKRARGERLAVRLIVVALAAIVVGTVMALAGS